MRKAMGWIVLSMFLSATAFAAKVDGPDTARHMHREEMKKIKTAQRAARKTEDRVKSSEPSKWGRFWKKEGERSGLGNTGSGTGTFFKNLNPVPFFKKQEERYEARKSGAK